MRCDCCSHFLNNLCNSMIKSLFNYTFIKLYGLVQCLVLIKRVLTIYFKSIFLQNWRFIYFHSKRMEENGRLESKNGRYRNSY